MTVLTRFEGGHSIEALSGGCGLGQQGWGPGATPQDRLGPEAHHAPHSRQRTLSLSGQRSGWAAGCRPRSATEKGLSFAPQKSC